jgi:molecular chaperone DnaK (HSP70)
VQQLLRDYFGKDLQKSIQPDEVVAYGAAAQAGVLAGTEYPLCMLHFVEVNPLTLGIETTGGVMTPLIKRNSVFPRRESQTCVSSA